MSSPAMSMSACVTFLPLTVASTVSGAGFAVSAAVGPGMAGGVVAGCARAADAPIARLSATRLHRERRKLDRPLRLDMGKVSVLGAIVTAGARLGQAVQGDSDLSVPGTASGQGENVRQKAASASAPSGVDGVGLIP